VIISDHLKIEKEKDKDKDKDKDKEKDKEINLNHKNIIGVNYSKQIKPFSTFQLTVITGKNIANRNNENPEKKLQNSDSQIPDKEGYEENEENDDVEMKISRDGTIENKNENEKEDKNGDDSDSNSSDSNADDENDDELTYPSTTSKAYTLTEEVQRVLIEDFYPPISSSTVPGNSGRLYISLSSSSPSSSSSSPSSSSPSSSSSSPSPTPTPLRSSPIKRDVSVDVDVGDSENMNGEENE
jgi:hypothetical protein